MPKRTGYLYDKMLDRGFIKNTILKAARKRTRRKDIAVVLKDLDNYVEKIYFMLREDAFVPSKPKERRLYDESSQKWRIIKMVPFYPDGVVHWLLVEAMRPVLTRGMYRWSCASVPGRGGKWVHKRVQSAMRNDPKGTRYAAELDVAQYYPSISIRRLIRALSRKIKDKRFLRMVYAIMESCGGGLAIGYYICQWLANFFLEPLDHYIVSLPGVKYMTRYMDNITLLGPNKRKLHRARVLIEGYLNNKLSLSMKGNWQVYRTTFTRKAAERRLTMTDRQRSLRRPRSVSAVGYRFFHSHTTLRRRNFLRLTRQCRRAAKRLEEGRPVSFRQAAGLLSRIGQLQHCDSHNARVKYVDPIGVKNLKEAVRYESKRRQVAQRGLYPGKTA